MIARRNVLKLAAAMSASATLPFAWTPREAAAFLAEPAEYDPGIDRPFAWERDDDLVGLPPGPSAFAYEAARAIPFEDFSGFVDGTAEPWSAYKQGLDRVIEQHPELAPLRLGDPLNDLDELVVDLWSASWMAGVRVGAALEHVRLAMITPRRLCADCAGHGRLWAGRPFHADGTPGTACAMCEGSGLVPTTEI